jgi:hypothetical protein
VYGLDDHPIVAIAAGKANLNYDAHSLALDSQGRVWAWGDNSQGALGGTSPPWYEQIPFPFMVPTLSNITAIDSGAGFSIARRGDGAVFAWGDNAYGQFGNGNQTSNIVPQQAVNSSDPTGFLTGIAAVAAGSHHVLVRDEQGGIWAWGGNDYGQLGIPFPEIVSTPVHLSSPTGVSALAAGNYHSLAFKGEFAPAVTHTVTPSAGPGGTINPSTPQSVIENATTSFTVAAQTGYHLASVSGCGGSLSGGTYTTGAVTADCTVAATFAINTYTVTPSAGAGGAINPIAPQTVNYNATTSFTVAPDTGYHLEAVSGCGGSLSGGTYTTGAVTADCTVAATFAINTYIVTPSAGPGGTINPNAPQTVNYNATTSFTVAPETGYHLEAVTGCGGSLSASTYTTGPVTADCTVSATWRLTPDTTPDPFVFASRANAPLHIWIWSNAISVSGINIAVPISISGGEYEINGSGSWTSASGMVNEGEAVRVRVVSSGSRLTTVDTTLTIGGVSAVFRVTTYGGAANDFDGDGKADIAIFREEWGAWLIYPSESGVPYGLGWGRDPADIPVPGDYDGDGRTDVAIYRAGSGDWWIIPSSTGAPFSAIWGGEPSDIPVPGDYDGDGETDIAIYRQAWGAWYIQPSRGGEAIALGWGGGPADIPVPGDYDGDGLTDIAIYRPEWGAWWIIPSSTGMRYGVGLGGGPTDLPVPGDYDGDGKTDIAIYRQEWGAWFITPSAGGDVIGLGWGGNSTDIPVPGDYDGDGITDVAIYRAENGSWWIIPSSTGTSYGAGFGGAASDIPVITNPALR